MGRNLSAGGGASADSRSRLQRSYDSTRPTGVSVDPEILASNGSSGAGTCATWHDEPLRALAIARKIQLQIDFFRAAPLRHKQSMVVFASKRWSGEFYPCGGLQPTRR